MKNLDFVQKFITTCLDAYKQGWHERNGGNLTYRLSDDDVDNAKSFFVDENEWVDMGIVDATLADSYFLTTASGAHMKNMNNDTLHSCGIVHINENGSAYKIVWGLADGVKPTSEFPSHYLNHCVRYKCTNGESRVIYHAHPANLIALSAILPVDAKTYSRALWKVMTECVVIFPEGIGVLPWMIPGGADIALETSKLMNDYQSVVWSQHGLFCAGNTLDDAFGLMHTIEKASEIYIKQCCLNAACGSKNGNDFLNTISDENLLAIAKDFDVCIQKSFLNLDI